MSLLRVMFLIAVSICATTQGADSKSPLETLELADGDCIVFLGDSITHQRLYTQYVEDFFYTRFPQLRLRLHNAGVGGAKAWDALQRFDRDVAAYHPKYVTVLLGMNDGRYRSYNEDIWQTYHDDMTRLVKRLVEIGATPILMTPTMYDSRAALARKRKPAENYNSVLAYYGTWLREVAMNDGHGFVDMWGPLNNLTLRERKTQPEFTLIRDAVHPDAPGQLVMAYAIIDDLGLRRGISNIRIVVGRNGKPRITGRGGKASNAEAAATTLAFDWAADSLPWVVPEEARLGAELLKLGHRASREGLEVHGLRPGKYQLSIDGQTVGSYTHVQLERHIELQSNDQTPQYQQALQVAKINQERNRGPIGQLRREWSRFQQLARTRQALKGAPDNKQLAERLAQLEQEIEGMEERVKAFEKAAQELEDQIFKINQPQPHRYLLERVED